LAHSMVAGTILRDLVLGQENEWLEVYNSMRGSPIKSIPHALTQ